MSDTCESVLLLRFLARIGFPISRRICYVIPSRRGFDLAIGRWREPMCFGRAVSPSLGVDSCVCAVPERIAKIEALPELSFVT